MAAGKISIYIEQCSDFSMIVTLKLAGQTADLTGHAFVGEIRKTTSTKQLSAKFQFELQDQTKLATRGAVRVFMPGADTAKIVCDSSPTFERVLTQYTYDIYSTDTDGKEKRWLEGVASVSPSATVVFPAPVLPPNPADQEWGSTP